MGEEVAEDVPVRFKSAAYIGVVGHESSRMFQPPFAISHTSDNLEAVLMFLNPRALISVKQLSLTK